MNMNICTYVCDRKHHVRILISWFNTALYDLFTFAFMINLLSNNKHDYKMMTYLQMRKSVAQRACACSSNRMNIKN